MHIQVKQLTHKIPVNSLGLLEGIYRPDLLPNHYDASSEEAQTTLPLLPFDTPTAPQSTAVAQYDRDIQVAYTQLDYCEGYPTLNGMPFWTQLSFEPPEAYVCFNAYLQQYLKGARQLYYTLDDPLLHELPVTHRPSLALLEEYFHLYYWTHRAKSHDLFFAAHRRKERERRAIETEDHHYFQASRLMGLCEAYLDEKGEELIETMTPKAFIEFFKTAVQVQRISTGLPGNGPSANSTDGMPPAGATTEVILRTIAEQTRGTQAHLDQENVDKSDVIANNRQKLAHFLQNPEILRTAQELIIKINHPASQTPQGA